VRPIFFAITRSGAVPTNLVSFFSKAEGCVWQESPMISQPLIVLGCPGAFRPLEMDAFVQPELFNIAPGFPCAPGQLGIAYFSEKRSAFPDQTILAWFLAHF
jgi:hypothetical protein